MDHCSEGFAYKNVYRHCIWSVNTVTDWLLNYMKRWLCFNRPVACCQLPRDCYRGKCTWMKMYTHLPWAACPRCLPRASRDAFRVFPFTHFVVSSLGYGTWCRPSLKRLRCGLACQVKQFDEHDWLQTNNLHCGTNFWHLSDKWELALCWLPQLILFHLRTTRE